MSAMGARATMGFAWVFQLIMGRMLAKTARFRNEERVFVDEKGALL